MRPVMKAAIACDDWKLPIFEEVLTKAGFTFKSGPGVSSDTNIIEVEYTQKTFSNLFNTIRHCQAKSAERKN